MILTTATGATGNLNFTGAANGSGIRGFEALTLATGTNNITLDTVIQDSAAKAATDTTTAINAFHTITGGSGYDTVTLGDTSNAAAPAAAAANAINLTTVTGIEQFVNTGTTGIITFSGAALNGEILTGTGTGAVTLTNFADNFVFGSSAAASINGGAGNDTVTLLNGANAATTYTSVETIIGSAATTDTVVMAAGSTTSVSISGVETVTGGTGAQAITFTGSTGVTYVHAAGGSTDTINLAANGVADTIRLNDGVAVTDGVVAAADRLVVNSFNTAHDVVRLDQNQTQSGDATVTIQTVGNVPTAGITFAASTDVLALNFDLGGATNVIGASTDGAAILSNFGGQTLQFAAGTTEGYIVAYDNGNAYLYAVDAVAATPFVAADIVLIGTFNNVAVGAFNVANFSAAA